MTNLATTRLQQARVHMQAGNAAKAVELLEQARALARGDRQVLVPILRDLAQAYQAMGMSAKADRCTAELGAIAPGAMPGVQPPEPIAIESRGSIVPIVLVMTLVLLGVAGIAIVWMAAGMRYDTRPAATTGNAGPAIKESIPAHSNPPAVALSSSGSTATLAERHRALLIKENVGLVIQVARYRGMVAGQMREAEFPFGTGTCFAVGRNGLMLTNHHVIAPPVDGVPPTLQDLAMPSMVLQGLVTFVCLGEDASRHYEAQIPHVSSRYDLALLKVKATFARPLRLRREAVTLGEQIFVGGYPGAVDEILTQANVLQVAGRWFTEAASGKVAFHTWFDQGTFEPTLTAGIVSAANRQMANVSYIQHDAKTSGGNSGGPLLNRNNEAIGVVTLAGTTIDTQGYNFALSIPQIMDEIEPYLKSP